MNDAGSRHVMRVGAAQLAAQVRPFTRCLATFDPSCLPRRLGRSILWVFRVRGTRGCLAWETG